MNIDQIKSIKDLAEKEKWPYPKTFGALKEAGVEAYEITLSPYEVIYFGGQKSWKEPPHQEIPPLKINDTFSAETLQEVLAHHQKEKSSYASFLQGAASAGVKGYRVEMENRTVNYYGIDPTQHHCEYVP